MQSDIHPVVKQLIQLIQQYHWHQAFELAINQVQTKKITILASINNLDNYLLWINDLLYWIPNETIQGREIYLRFSGFYFILNQPSLRQLQSPILPSILPIQLSPLSQWMVNYAQAMGAFLDTAESFSQQSLLSFQRSALFRFEDYEYPLGGWKSFNHFFARHVKKACRPIQQIHNPAIIVSPADAVLGNYLKINNELNVNLKGLSWSIQQLLADSIYQSRFQNGWIVHGFLDVHDYHRLHSPIAGKVIETRIIQGQVYLEVLSKPIANDIEGKHELYTRDIGIDLQHSGYMFCQTRGLIILETSIGLIAILPIGMAQVSSVMITVEIGQLLSKGEELAYFQFGGSDILILFEANSSIHFTAQLGKHYLQGQMIAEIINQ